MKKYFLPLLLVSKCLFSQADVIDNKVEVIPGVTLEAYSTFAHDLCLADMQWKNEEKEEALRTYTTLLETCTNPLFSMAVSFRKGIIESQLGHQEEALSTFTSIVHKLLKIEDLVETNQQRLSSDDHELSNYYAGILLKAMSNSESIRHCPKSICHCPESLCLCPETVCPKVSTSETTRHCPKSICLCPESLCCCPERVCPQ